jgi:hypothetical protein
MRQALRDLGDGSLWEHLPMGYRIVDYNLDYIVGYVDKIANFESTEMRRKKKTLLFDC